MISKNFTVFKLHSVVMESPYCLKVLRVSFFFLSLVLKFLKIIIIIIPPLLPLSSPPPFSLVSPPPISSSPPSLSIKSPSSQSSSTSLSLAVSPSSSLYLFFHVLLPVLVMLGFSNTYLMK